MSDHETWGNDDQITISKHVISPGLTSDDHLLEQAHILVHFEGEREMLEQVLIDAIECWQSVSAKDVLGEQYVTSLRQRLYREADFWIFGDYNNAPFFSFIQICDCLRLNPDFIRRRLLEWRHKHSADR
jgi:hypothetical protein